MPVLYIIRLTYHLEKKSTKAATTQKCLQYHLHFFILIVVFLKKYTESQLVHLIKEVSVICLLK